jgi:hypothetical protein
MQDTRSIAEYTLLGKKTAARMSGRVGIPSGARNGGLRPPRRSRPLACVGPRNHEATRGRLHAHGDAHAHPRARHSERGGRAAGAPCGRCAAESMEHGVRKRSRAWKRKRPVREPPGASRFSTLFNVAAIGGKSPRSDVQLWRKTTPADWCCQVARSGTYDDASSGRLVAQGWHQGRGFIRITKRMNGSERIERSGGKFLPQRGGMILFIRSILMNPSSLMPATRRVSST